MNWKEDGRLVPDSTDVVPFLYRTRTVTDFMQRSAKNFGDARPPTFYDLLVGRQRLFLAQELEQVLGLTQSGVSWQTMNGNLPVLALGKKALRYPSAPIRKMLTAVPKNDAARILGLEPPMILELVRDRRLDRLNVPGHGTALFVTQESLRAYLADRLADSGVPAGIWWEDQLAYEGAMLSPNQIRDVLRIAWETVNDLLVSGRLPFIRTPGNFRLVPERYVHWLSAGRTIGKLPPARESDLTDVQIGAMFAVMPRVARAWVRDGLLCEQHVTCRRVECARRFITSHSTNTAFTADEWMAWAAPSSPVTLVDAEGIIETDEPAFITALRDGRLRGVWSPDQRLVIHELDLQRFLRWYERQIIGPDYHQY